MKTQQLSKNPSLTHHSILNDVCAPLKTLGINFFGYTAVDAKGNAFCLGSKADYAAEYLRRNHAQNDVHQYTADMKKQFRYDFWDYLEMDRNTTELYQMAAAFDQGHTLTVTKHDAEMTQCYHFSAPMANSEMNQIYLEKMDSLHAFISFFDDCMATIPELAAVYDLPINIDSVKNKKADVVSIVSDPRQINLQTTAINTLTFKNQSHYYLSKDERECLQWLHLGKSAEMIAQIKGVSRKTIERYISSLKKKYDCYTLYQLGEKVAASGLVNFLTAHHPNCA